MILDKTKSKKPSYSGNSIMVRPNGPLICKSDNSITLQNEKEELIVKEKEIALCRCGFSKNKPFCDASHKTVADVMPEMFSDKREESIENIEGDLTITVKDNSMYKVHGPVTIFSRDGLSKTTRNNTALCRCGKSANKPFCDGKHKQL